MTNKHSDSDAQKETLDELARLGQEYDAYQEIATSEALEALERVSLSAEIGVGRYEDVDIVRSALQQSEKYKGVDVKEIRNEVVKSLCGEHIDNNNASIASMIGTTVSRLHSLGHLRAKPEPIEGLEECLDRCQGDDNQRVDAEVWDTIIAAAIAYQALTIRSAEYEN